MPLIQRLVHALLVLALLAGGVAPGAAAAADGGGEAPMSAPCHDLAGDAVEPALADCCDEGGCTCECVHHTPVGFLAAAQLPRLAVVGVNQGSPAAVLPMASGAPEIRPPLA